MGSGGKEEEGCQTAVTTSTKVIIDCWSSSGGLSKSIRGDNLGDDVFLEISYLLKTAGNLSCLNWNWVGR